MSLDGFGLAPDFASALLDAFFVLEAFAVIFAFPVPFRWLDWLRPAFSVSTLPFRSFRFRCFEVLAPVEDSVGSLPLLFPLLAASFGTDDVEVGASQSTARCPISPQLWQAPLMLRRLLRRSLTSLPRLNDP